MCVVKITDNISIDYVRPVLALSEYILSDWFDAHSKYMSGLKGSHSTNTNGFALSD